MTYVNVSIQTDSEWNSYHYDHTQRTELELWKRRALELQNKLDNIYDHASKTGEIELWRNGEKLRLVKPPIAP